MSLMTTTSYEKRFDIVEIYQSRNSIRGITRS